MPRARRPQRRRGPSNWRASGSGEDDRLTLDRARLELLAREQALASARTEAANAAVAVYKALGGAWQAQTPADNG